MNDKTIKVNHAKLTKSKSKSKEFVHLRGSGLEEAGSAREWPHPSLCFSRQLEVHSPDAKHTVILRSKDSATAQAWFSAIHSNVSDLLSQVIAEVREQLGQTGIAGSREIRHLGWLAEKVRKMFPTS